MGDGRAERDEAIQRVDRHTESEWRLEARALVSRLAYSLPAFTTDDVWDRLVNRPHEPRALGAVMLWARRRGFIEATDEMRESDRPEAHRNPKRVWRSRMFKETPATVIHVESTGRTITRRCTRTMPKPIALAPAVGDLRRHEPKPRRGSAQSKKPVEQVRRNPAPKLTGDALQDYLDKKAGL